MREIAASLPAQLQAPTLSSVPVDRPTLKVAYIMSRFPKLTETFILFEIEELKALGVQVEIYPLLHEREPVVHRAAEALVPEVNFRPFLSFSILYAQLHFFLRNPVTYFKTLVEILWGTLGSFRYFAGAVVYFPKAVRFAYEMAQKHVDHVHAHFANHPSLVAFVVHRLTGIPYSFTAHGADLQVDQHMLSQKVKAAEYVVSISEYNKELIVAECGEQYREKIHVIHCGIDPNVFTVQTGRSASPLNIICVASFGEVKGHKYLIKACRILRARGVDFVCSLVGDGPLRREIEALIEEADLQKHIKLLGNQTRHSVAALMSKSDVLALTSVYTRDGRREGIPVAIMEGMASCLPVVASEISGIPELVESGRTGILVRPRDPEAIADALEMLAKDQPLRAAMGKAGREKVVREFNLRRNAEKLLNHFGESKQVRSVRQPTYRTVEG